jgi:hypothetical protein
MSTRNISCGVKAASVQGWEPCHFHVLTVLKSGSLNLLEPYGPVQACNGIAFMPQKLNETSLQCWMQLTYSLKYHCLSNTIPKHWGNTSPWQEMQQHFTTEIRLLHLQWFANGHFYFLIIAYFVALLQWPTIFKLMPTRERHISVLRYHVERQQLSVTWLTYRCTLQWLPFSFLWHIKL